MPIGQKTEEREQRLQVALTAYRSAGLPEYNSIRKAAAAHGVSQSKLGDRVRGFSCSKEEASLQKQNFYPQYLIYMSETNLAISVHTAVHLAEAIYRRKPGNSNTRLGEH